MLLYCPCLCCHSYLW